MNNDQHEIYENARKRVKEKKRLYFHFILFLVGSIFLIILEKVFKVGENFYENWFVWAILLWFFFWVLHFVNVFFTSKFMGKEWERKQTEKLVLKQELKIAKLEKDLAYEEKLKAESKQYSQELKEKSKPEPQRKKMITIIAAIAENNALGKNNELIWHIPADLKRFKKVTSGHDVIMGRNTFESLGKPLPNRTNIVITRNKNYVAEGCIVVHSLNEAIYEASEDENPFILGGAQIYAEAIKIADKLDVTLVHQSFEADAFFPEIDKNIWEEVSREDFEADEKNKYNYSFVTYIKRT